jgi:hopanoid biosynthesis associated RND transporter like protein HpnN
VLFVGLAVDFAIQFCVRARELRHVAGADGFLGATATVAGPPILIAAAAAAAGFLAFGPTPFRGVAELGIIAGAGMVIAFCCTFTFLPAALALCRPRGETGEVGLRAGAWLEPHLHRQRRLVVLGFLAAGAAGAALLPMVHFDSDPLHTKDPTTESMRVLADLMDEPLTNPYSADILAPSRAAADALAPRLAALPGVGEVITLSSFVPADQPAKLTLIADAAGLLGPSLAERAPAAPVTPADIRLAAGAARAQIEHAGAKLKPDDPLRAIGEDLAQLEKAPDAVLLAADAALTRFLPAQLARLRLVLAVTGPVDVASIPPEIARDWALPDGRVRVHVVPRPGQELVPFVAALRTVAPDAGGSAVTIVETAATIVSAFRQAAFSAVLAIALLLAVVLRRMLDVALVLAALALSALITVLLVVVLGMSFNFANIIALPLLQGVGVAFNIYFVMNWRAGYSQFLGTATARAILFSALTTATAFGSLALSHHPGTASMGKLLLLSLGSTLAVTLAFLPVVLRALMRER